MGIVMAVGEILEALNLGDCSSLNSGYNFPGS